MHSNKSFLLLFLLLFASCAEKDTSLELFIHKELQSGEVPGIGVSIIIDGDILLSRGFGYADIENQVPFTDSTIMNIASISKTFIGVSMMHAVENGFLSLDDDVNKFLSFAVVNPHRPEKIITIRHLLGHRSSIIDEKTVYFSKCYNYGGDATTPLEIFLRNYLSKNGPYFSSGNFLDQDPGSEHHYSNIGSALAAHVLEKIMVKPFNILTKEIIFEPLSMENTSWFLSEMKDQSKHAKLYKKDNDKAKLSEIEPYGLITYPDGGLRTSVKDLSKYLNYIMNNKPVLDNPIINETSKENMFTPDFNQDYAKFWDTKDHIGHGGGDPGVTTSMYFDPKNKIGIILFTNTSTYGNFYTLLKKVYNYSIELKKASHKV